MKRHFARTRNGFADGTPLTVTQHLHLAFVLDNLVARFAVIRGDPRCIVRFGLLRPAQIFMPRSAGTARSIHTAPRHAPTPAIYSPS